MHSALLDANVISGLVRERPEPRLVDFARSRACVLVSVLALHELA